MTQNVVRDSHGFDQRLLLLCHIELVMAIFSPGAFDDLCIVIRAIWDVGRADIKDMTRCVVTCHVNAKRLIDLPDDVFHCCRSQH